MSKFKSQAYPGQQGSGSPLFYINSWAMIWPTDYPAAAR